MSAPGHSSRPDPSAELEPGPCKLEREGSTSQDREAVPSSAAVVLASAPSPACDPMSEDGRRTALALRGTCPEASRTRSLLKSAPDTVSLQTLWVCSAFGARGVECQPQPRSLMQGSVEARGACQSGAVAGTVTRASGCPAGVGGVGWVMRTAASPATGSQGGSCCSTALHAVYSSGRFAASSTVSSSATDPAAQGEPMLLWSGIMVLHFSSPVLRPA